MTWEMLGDLSADLELWETALVTEIMKEKIYMLKAAKINILQEVGVVVDNDVILVNKEEYNMIMEECISEVWKRTRKLFLYKNRIIMLAINMNQL